MTDVDAISHAKRVVCFVIRVYMNYIGFALIYAYVEMFENVWNLELCLTCLIIINICLVYV